MGLDKRQARDDLTYPHPAVTRAAEQKELPWELFGSVGVMMMAHNCISIITLSFLIPPSEQPLFHSYESSQNHGQVAVCRDRRLSQTVIVTANLTLAHASEVARRRLKLQFGWKLILQISCISMLMTLESASSAKDF